MKHLVVGPRRLPITSAWLVPAVLSAVVVVVVSGAAVTAFETRTVSGFGQGLWWATSLITTVGFIGEPPESTAGAVLSAVLMVVGFLLLAMVSASLAALFVREEELPRLEEETSTDQQILEALARLEARLDDPPRDPVGPTVRPGCGRRTPVSTAADAPSPTGPAPLDRVRWPVRTERLTLRPATAGDAEATWHYRRLPEVAQWVTVLPTDPDTYRETFVAPARLATTVIVERDGELIGDVMIRVEDAWSQAEVAADARGTQAELGWVLDPRFAGQGYATEAVRELLRVCFEELGLRRVVAFCFLDNVGSSRLMERIGMRRETHAVAEALHRDGRWLDSLGYAMLATEWRARTGVARP